MNVVTLKPGHRVTLAPYLDAMLVSVGRDGVKLELISTGPQLPVHDADRADQSADKFGSETADSDNSRFFAEFA